jgi:hypothetical protein
MFANQQNWIVGCFESERKGSLDVHIKNQTENDFEVCFREFQGLSK